MAGPAVYPKPFDNLVLANLNSPRFDIADFLKTPTDGSPKVMEAQDEDALFPTFQGFSLPHAPFTCATPVATAEAPHQQSQIHQLHTTDTHDHIEAGVPPCSESNAHLLVHSDGEFATVPVLFEDCKGADFTIDNVLNHGEFIPFDDYIDGVLDGGDSFSIFNDADYKNTASSNGMPNLGYVPYLSVESGMMMPPSLSGPSPSIYALPEPCLGSEAAGLMEVGDHLLVGASTLGVPSSWAYPSGQMDWGVINRGTSFPDHLGQSGTKQCESCQLLRRIIHSNGVQDTKLEIHNCQGQSYHAVLQTRFCIDDGFPSTLERQMVDFPVGNSEYVKQFLLQYSMLRSKEGFIHRHDSLQAPLDLPCDASDRLMGGANMHMLNQLGQGRLTQCGSSAADPGALLVKPPKSNAAAQVLIKTVTYIYYSCTGAQRF